MGCWEFKGVTDKSYMTYLAAGVVGVLVLIALTLPGPNVDGLVQKAHANTTEPDGPDSSRSRQVLEGFPLYVSQCARCHGLDGAGDGPGAKSPTFSAVPRDLTEGHFQFVSTSNGVASQADLRHAIVHGLTGSGMPGFAALSDRQIDSLIETVEFFWKDRPAPGETIEIPARPAATPAMIEQGKELYAGMCSVCHGPTGAGDGVLTALRTDAAGRPVQTRNLRNEPLKGGASDKQLYYRIAAGLPRNTGEWLMPAYANLGSDKIWALITYLEAEVLPPRRLAERR
jgi:mono/diheme cytochrome c family protein